MVKMGLFLDGFLIQLLDQLGMGSNLARIQFTRIDECKRKECDFGGLLGPTWGTSRDIAQDDVYHGTLH